MAQKRPNVNLDPLIEPEDNLPVAGGWKDQKKKADTSSNITIRAKDDVLDEFKAACQRPGDTPRSYGVMLAKLMQRWKETGGEE